jgi:SNF2 family DNA or RNA helicase
VLSGTPAPNDQSEYWAQIKFITGPGNECFNDNFFVFRSRYFTAIQIGKTKQDQQIFTPDVIERQYMVQKLLQMKMKDWDRKFIESVKDYPSLSDFSQKQLQLFWMIWNRYMGNTRNFTINKLHDEFKEKMKGVCDVVRKEDVADLPEQVHEIRKVYLGKEEQKAYDTMKKDLVLQFSKEEVLASTALTEILKLRQLTSGFVYGEEGTHIVGRSKLNETKALMEEIGHHQVIIWANFKQEIRSILELMAKMGIKAEGVWSETKDRNQVIKDFQTNVIQVIVANPMSAAHGLSFDNCKYNIDFSMNYSYEFHKQSRDRTHGMNRGIKGQSTTYYYLLADGTIDEPVYKVVAKNGDLSTGILNYLRS